MKIPLTIIINTKNSEKTLERTLQSVDFASDIVVVDMASTDGTNSVARKFTKRVYQFEDVGYVEPARNFAISKADTEWVLVVDSDEEIPPTLAKKIKELISHKTDIACYFLPRKNIIFGKWIQKTGWWPDFQPRLFKATAVKWKDTVHSVPEITGSIEYLPVDSEQAIIHHNYESVSDYLQRLDRYTSISAQESDSKQDFSPAELVTKFADELDKRLFFEKGIEEGIHGVGLSFLQGMYEVATYMKIWERSNSKDTVSTVAETIAAIKTFKKSLAYWVADYQVKHSTGLTRLQWQLRRKFKI